MRCLSLREMEIQEKIKPVLNGTAETMLQSFYARAEYSQRKTHKFYDTKAVELVNRIDYDFSTASKDRTMSSGVIARTLVLDELVKDFIGRNPTATIVNIACGLDTRFYRVDNGIITWYNLDLPDVIKLRDQILLESGRVSSIGASALDPNWFKEVKNRKNVLFIIEGLSMYLTAEENAKILSIIRKNFDTATVIMECIAKMWVKRERVEKSIQKTGARFVFGADSFDDIKNIAQGFHKIKDDNILRGMRVLTPALKLIDWLPIARKITQKILVFSKQL